MYTEEENAFSQLRCLLLVCTQNGLCAHNVLRAIECDGDAEKKWDTSRKEKLQLPLCVSANRLAL